MMRLLRRQPRILASRQAYARWANSYPAHAHNAFMQLEQDAMQTLMPDLQAKRVLDLACGTGRWGIIAKAAGAQVIGVDHSWHMLAAAELTNTVQAELAFIPLPNNSIDIILCGLAIGHTPNLEGALKEIARVLRPGGVALISDLHPFQAWNDAQRTFVTGGKTYAVEHHIHSYMDWYQAALAANLHITGLLEVGTGPQEPPVVLVIRLEAGEVGDAIAG